MLKSKAFIITLVLFILFSLFIFLEREVIFREGNPIPMALAIGKLTVQDKGIAQVWKNEQFIVKRGNMEPFIEVMEKKGWELVERDKMSNTMTFKKGNDTTAFSYEYYTRYYTLINGYVS